MSDTTSTEDLTVEQHDLHEQHDQHEEDVDGAACHPGRDARDGHLDRDPLAGDQVVSGVAAVAPGVAHPVMLTRADARPSAVRLPGWTSTRTSWPTGPSGSGSRS